MITATDLFTLRTATLAARARTGDAAISTRVSKGQVQVIRATFDALGRATITPVSDYGTTDAAVATLATITGA